MTPSQVLIVAALGGAAGLLTLAAIAALSYAIGITANRAFERLHDFRVRRADRRELAACLAIQALPTHDRTKDPR